MSPGRRIFHYVARFCQVAVSFFKHTCTNDICWVYKTRTGEATYWPGKLKNSRGSGEAKFSPDEGEKSTKSGFTGSVTEECFIDA